MFRLAEKTLSVEEKGRISPDGADAVYENHAGTWNSCIKTAIGILAVLSFFLLSGCQKNEGKPETKVKAVTQNGIVFSHESGLYADSSLKVHMKAPAGYTIAFTTNGTRPSAADASGKAEVEVILTREMTGYLLNHKKWMLYPEFTYSTLHEDQSLPYGVVLNTALVDEKGAVGDKVQTNVYYLREDYARRFAGCLMVSVTTDAKNLLDYNTGILASGAVYDAWKKTDEAKKVIEKQEWWNVETNSTQRGQKWERPCQIQFYQPKNALPDLEMEAGIRIRGGMSRRQNQKSFTLYFRKPYGTDLLRYKLFDKAGEYETFALRDGGNDAEFLKYKDIFLQDLGRGGKFTVLDSRPAVLFLNGEYWGVYLLNEILSGKTLHTRFSVDEKNVVAIKESEVQVGAAEDIKYYKELQSFGEKDLTDPEIYKQFCDVMDVQSMADYFALQIYIGNGDVSPVHNHVLWRTKDTSYNGGRWQFILHDLDYSAGHYEEPITAATTDHFALARKNFPVFNAAVKNKEFYDLFLKALKKAGSENYSYDRVRKKIDSYNKVWEPLMPDFYKRFGDTSELRKRCLNAMLTFFQRRYQIIVPIVEKEKP
ncbi:MAG TPA: hypothetical protein DCS50_05670 [Acidaminococcaceae bacterium]|nr:hypothetical protein [Acidaminococcaceae bacterium]